MGEPPLHDKIAALVVTVRNNSRQGRLTPLQECWEGPPEPLFEGISEFDNEIGDVESIREGDMHYLFSTRFITRRYAHSSALALSGELARIIAETVRDESATYPRPTSIDLFSQHPYSLARQDIEVAIAEMGNTYSYQDIKQVTASDGSLFLYSSDHMNRDQAQSLAEWIAVGDSENP